MILNPQRLTSSTVKTRRLGYILAIPRILGNNKFSTNLLVKKIIEWSLYNEENFKVYGDSLPAIRLRTKERYVGKITGFDSAVRYIKLVEEIGLITFITNSWQNTKLGNVIRFLDGKDNPFRVSLNQIFLLFKLFLEKDFDYLASLWEILQRKPYIPDKEATRLFREKVEERWNRKLETAISRDIMSVVASLKRALRRIKDWREPVGYYRDCIKAPRLEWLLDLRILRRWNQKTKTYIFRAGIEKFFKKDLMDLIWLDETYPYIFYEFFRDEIPKLDKWADLSDSEKSHILQLLLDNSMELFKPADIIHKISASQFLDYSLCKMISEYGVIGSYSEIEKDLLTLSRQNKLPYKYVRIISDVDRGYILRR